MESTIQKGYVDNVHRIALDSTNFREVLYTATQMQLVVMSLLPSEAIGEEVHDLDQCIRVEDGEGTAVLDGHEHPIISGSMLIIPKGMRHDIRNTSTTVALKLSTLYAPPDHRDKVIHATKADAVAEDAPFDGVTTE